MEDNISPRVFDSRPARRTPKRCRTTMTAIELKPEGGLTSEGDSEGDGRVYRRDEKEPPLKSLHCCQKVRPTYHRSKVTPGPTRTRAIVWQETRLTRKQKGAAAGRDVKKQHNERTIRFECWALGNHEHQTDQCLADLVFLHARRRRKGAERARTIGYSTSHKELIDYLDTHSSWEVFEHSRSMLFSSEVVPASGLVWWTDVPVLDQFTFEWAVQEILREPSFTKRRPGEHDSLLRVVSEDLPVAGRYNCGGERPEESPGLITSDVWRERNRGRDFLLQNPPIAESGEVIKSARRLHYRSSRRPPPEDSSAAIFCRKRSDDHRRDHTQGRRDQNQFHPRSHFHRLQSAIDRRRLGAVGGGTVHPILLINNPEAEEGVKARRRRRGLQGQEQSAWRKECHASGNCNYKRTMSGNVGGDKGSQPDRGLSRGVRRSIVIAGPRAAASSAALIVESRLAWRGTPTHVLALGRSNQTLISS
ncbi:hypothetical protein J6590_049435 [Homalodisca vitripennis]|nr:hypothetical protein J6590_049435 [Homalodisca vitripennis]